MKLRIPAFDSLFSRLLLVQIGLVIVLGLVFVGLFYVERNVTVAMLYADQWAPQLASEAGLVPEPASLVPVIRRDHAPSSARHPSPLASRFTALHQTLQARGVPVDDVMISLDDSKPMVWLYLTPVDRPAVWLGMDGKAIVPEWSRRAWLALVLVSALVVVVSWAFTRRLTRPLERLHERMHTHTPDNPGLQLVGSGAAISPEIVAIDAAYSALLARLQQHERERSVLLAGVSHDLRGPLGRIRMATELLPDTAEVSVRKTSIVRNVSEADYLIESFLDFVRSGELAFDEIVDLAAISRAVVANFERPTHELDIKAPASLLWPRANRLLVERLLTNLIDNALKHGFPPVHVMLGADEKHAWIDVEDAGEGIVPQLVDRMQEAFTRGDNSRTKAGSGVGLAIVRQVTTRLGGEISFKQADGTHRVRVTLRATDNWNS